MQKCQVKITTSPHLLEPTTRVGRTTLDNIIASSFKEMELYPESYQVRGENGFRPMPMDSYNDRSGSQRRETERMEWSPYRSSRSRTPFRTSRSRSPVRSRSSRSRSPFARSRSRTPFGRSESQSPTNIRSRSRSRDRSCSPYARRHTFSEDYSRPPSSSIWECAVCLEVFNDRKDLLKHLSASGHSWNFRDASRKGGPPERKRPERNNYSNPPYVQNSQHPHPTPNMYGREYPSRKQKGRSECFICHEQFPSHGQLEKHISITGHRWSYRKAQQLKEQARDASRIYKNHNFQADDHKEQNSNFWQHNSSVDVNFNHDNRSECSSAILSPERSHERESRPGESTSAAKSPFLVGDSSKSDAVLIPLEATTESNGSRDPRPRTFDPPKYRSIAKVASASKSHKWSPALSRGFQEGIQWKLVPIELTTYRSAMEKNASNIPADSDPVTNSTKLSNDLSGSKKLWNSRSSSSSSAKCPIPPSAIRLQSSPQTETNIPCRSTLENHLELSPDTTSTRFDPLLPQPPLCKPLNLVPENNTVINPKHVPTLNPLTQSSSKPDLSIMSSLPVGENERVETDDLCEIEGDDSVFSSRSSSPVSEPETITVRKAVDDCPHCCNPFCISRFSINVSTGDVTTSCTRCGTRTIMEGVFRLA